MEKCPSRQPLGSVLGWTEKLPLGLDWALFGMSALRATAFAINRLCNDLALGGAPAGDNLATTLGANSYFVGAGFEHEGRRG